MWSKKKTVVLKFRELRMFDFRIFCYAGKHVCYICWQYLPLWIVSLFLTNKNVSHVLVSSSIFYYSKKFIKETVLSFVDKIKLNVEGHLKCWLWCLSGLLWAEHKFNCVITGLRKAEKMLLLMLLLFSRARQQPIKTLKQSIHY